MSWSCCNQSGSSLLLCALLAAACSCSSSARDPEGPAPQDGSGSGQGGPAAFGEAGSAVLVAAPVAAAPASRSAAADGSAAEQARAPQWLDRPRPAPSTPELLARALIEALATGNSQQAEALFIAPEELQLLFGESSNAHHGVGLARLRSRFAELAASPSSQAAARVLSITGAGELRLARGEQGCRQPLVLRQHLQVLLATPTGEQVLPIGMVVLIHDIWRLVEI